MKKLSANLQELTNRVANMENRVSAAQNESKERVQASIAKAKADAKARQDSVRATAEHNQSLAASKWEELRNSYNRQVAGIKNKIETDKEALEAKHARRRADDFILDAEAATEFALMAVDDAELAWLEAIEADMYADSFAEK